MIQQSQLSLMQMLFAQHPPVLNQDLIEEQYKITMSPYPTQQEIAPPTPDIHKKMSKKTPSDTPKSRRGKAQEIANPNQKFGHWALEENKRYHWFLEIHNHHFLNKHMRRMDKIFKTMAVFVGTREAEQCRSHHQKMQKKYHTIGKILLNLRKHHYDSQCEEFIIEDLNRNSVEIVDDILSSTFLNSIINEQIPQSLSDRRSSFHHSEYINDLNLEQEEEKKVCGGDDDDEGLKIMPLNPEGYGKDIVDELFGEVAPHFNFEMI